MEPPLAVGSPTPLCPATTTPTVSASIRPFAVSTPLTLPPSIRKPVTSQFWMMSTPRASAAREPPGHGIVPGGPAATLEQGPRTGNRQCRLMKGTHFLTSAGVRNSESTPCMRIA